MGRPTLKGGTPAAKPYGPRSVPTALNATASSTMSGVKASEVECLGAEGLRENVGELTLAVTVARPRAENKQGFKKKRIS